MSIVFGEESVMFINISKEATTNVFVGNLKERRRRIIKNDRPKTKTL